MLRIALRPALVAAGLLLSLTLAAPARAQLPVGADAPDFTLVDTAGAARSLSDSMGEVVVLFFIGHG